MGFLAENYMKISSQQILPITLRPVNGVCKLTWANKNSWDKVMRLLSLYDSALTKIELDIENKHSNLNYTALYPIENRSPINSSVYSGSSKMDFVVFKYQIMIYHHALAYAESFFKTYCK